MNNAMMRDDLVIQGIENRRKKYPQFIECFDSLKVSSDKSLVQLEENGFVTFDGVVEHDTAIAIKEKVDRLVQTGKCLQLPRDLHQVTDGGEEYWKVGRIDETTVQKGEELFKHRTHLVQVSEPLLQFPELLKIGLDERVIDLVGAYMGCLPSLGFVKITKSLVNDLPPFDTQLFHIDGNAAKMVKAFLLLSDVDESSGPHAVVKNSHRDRFEGCFSKNRWTTEEMIAEFGKDRVFFHLGKAGDLIVEDTSAFHCGLKPITNDRTIVVFNYVPHEEYGGGGAMVKAPKSLLDSFSEKQKYTADGIEFI